jgi:hypothetical protein
MQLVGWRVGERQTKVIFRGQVQAEEGSFAWRLRMTGERRWVKDAFTKIRFLSMRIRAAGGR